MLTPADNSFVISDSPHSIQLDHDVTTPSWVDNNPLVINEKNWNAHGFQGLGCDCGGSCDKGLSGLGSVWEGLLGVVAFAIVYPMLFRSRY